MSVVKRVTVNLANNEIIDKGITVRDALQLIEKSDYYDELYGLFNVSEYLDDFINIEGAAEVVRSLIRIDEEYEKFDLKSEFKNVRVSKFTEDKQVLLEFSNIQDSKIIETTKKDIILAESAYSVKSEYFNELYNIDKYLDFCLDNGFKDIVDANVSMLEEKFKDYTKQKKFRILKSKEGKYIVRAFTSVDSYKDYNLRFSLFIALIELHKLIKFKDHSYSISYYSITESDAKIVFKRGEKFKLFDKTTIGFGLEIINDEIKKESVKFNGVFTINFGEDKEIYIRPDDVKSGIISFSHSTNVDKVKLKLNDLALKIDEFIKDMLIDIEKIKSIKDPDNVREFLKFKILTSRTPEINSFYKNDINRILMNKVDNIYQLFETFNKIDSLINDEHIIAKDFWRHKLYQALVRRGVE